MSAPETQFYWNQMAERQAKATFSNVKSQRGVFCVAGDIVVVFVHQHAAYPALHRFELAVITHALMWEDIPVLAEAAYPETGRSAGHTVVLLARAGRDKLEWLDQLVTDTAAECWHEQWRKDAVLPATMPKPAVAQAE